jgi:hypothetical protein
MSDYLSSSRMYDASLCDFSQVLSQEHGSLNFTLFLFVWFGFFLGGGVRDRVSLCSPGCLRTHSIV